MQTEDSIRILKAQTEKLNEKKFDLNAWKNSTIILLERIFGGDNKKIAALRNIKYDQGSWVLRDETGYTNSMDACRKMGRDVLETAIVELENFGMPEVTVDQIDFRIILHALEDELSGSEFREIKRLLSRESSTGEKKKLIMTRLKSFGQDTAGAIIAHILTNKQVSSRLKD